MLEDLSASPSKGLLQMQLIKINSLGWDFNPICLYKTELWAKT